jgi:hypothetical protein
MMVEAPRDLQEEVDDLIGRVGAFQAAHSRKIAKYFKRSRKARLQLDALSGFGLPISDAYKAMYWNHNGVDPGATMSWLEMAVFLDYSWPDIETTIATNEITRNSKHRPTELISPDRLWAFADHSRVSDLEFKPELSRNGEIPLIATVGALSSVEYIAFDSCLSFLRTAVSAQEAGFIRYDERGRIQYPVDELLSVVGLHNQHQTYWTALARDEIDWKIPAK